MRNLELLNKNNIPFDIKTKVTNLNINEKDKIREFAKKMDARFTSSPMLHPCLDRDKSPINLRISSQEMADCFKEEDAEKDLCGISSEGVMDNATKMFNCGAASFSAYIDFTGKLIACECLREPHLDLKKTSLKQGLEFLLKFVQGSNFDEKSECIKCGIKHFCVVCPGMRKIEINNLNGKIEYFCEVARIRDEQRKEAII